jgi:lipid A 3-O-deacylase
MNFKLHPASAAWSGLIFSFGAIAADSAQSFAIPYGYGKTYVGFQVGYGAGFRIGISGQGDAKDVTYLATFPSFGVGLSDPIGGDSWYHGNFDLVAEGEFITFLGPGPGHSMGLALLLRYNFLSQGNFVPYAEIGVGAGFIESSLEFQADGPAFYPQGGVGVNFFIADDWAVNLSYRYHHISNRGMKKPNTGINANLGLLGVQYHFD